MATFVIVAALMALLAAAAVALPLMRDRHQRWLGAAAGSLVIGAAAGLYLLWSTWDWRAPAGGTAPPDVAAMISKLEAHLRDDPNDAAGWVMAGRSYTALERLDDAIVAYDHAHRLDAGNAEAALGLGEAMSLKAGGNITPEAAALFESALATAPDNPKALLYGGFAAASRGDTRTARQRWEAVKALHPPEQIEQMLDARIAELGAPGAGGGAGVAPAAATSPVAGSGPVAVPASAAGTEVTVNIRIAPALAARLTREAPLFVFAREPGGGGPPLAAKRLSSAAIGTQIHLSAADSMIPGRALVNGAKVSITARVSFSGQPLPSAGDLYGELTYDVGHDGVRDLVIDRVSE